jgi:hypothetical protein
MAASGKSHLKTATYLLWQEPHSPGGAGIMMEAQIPGNPQSGSRPRSARFIDLPQLIWVNVLNATAAHTLSMLETSMLET